MKTAYAYIRVSTVKQGEHGSSLTEQRHAIEQYAQRHDLTIMEWFEEMETAAKRGRTQFTRMLSLLLKGRAHGVIIHKIDRGARNLRDWADLGGLIDKGIDVHFAHESLDMQSRGGRLAADIQAVVAADYIRNLRDEVRKGFLGRLRQGLYPLRAPLGYLDKGGGLPKIPDPATAPLVQLGFKLYATGEHTLYTLENELYRAGLRNRNGKRVTRNGLSTMLNNEFYTGIIHIKRTAERFQGVHEPLVKKSVFDKVNEMLMGKTKSRGLKHSFRYRRTLRCINCGYSLVGTLSKGKVYYRCQTRDCPTACVREDRVDEQMKNSLYKVLLTPEQSEHLEHEFAVLEAERYQHRFDLIAAKELAVRNINDRISRLTDALIDQLIDKAAFDERNKTLLHEKAQACESLEGLKAELDGESERSDRFLQLTKDIFQAVENGNEHEKRDILKTATSNLQIEGKNLVLTWLEPFNEIISNGKNLRCEPYRDTSPTLARKDRYSASNKKPHVRVSKFSKKLFGLIHQSDTNPSSQTTKRKEG